jgi:hypothetical protein
VRQARISDLRARKVERLQSRHALEVRQTGGK